MNEERQKFVAQHVATLPKSGIRDFFALVSQRPDAISLAIGEPDFVTPWHIREAAWFALELGKTSYTDNSGLIQLRREISKYVGDFFKLDYQPNDEILVTVGVSEALDLVLRATLNPGDKVIYHHPCYVSYNPSIQMAHAEAVGVPTSSENQFTLDPEDLRKAWQPRCKALILNFPTNPTGGTASAEVLKEIAAFAIEKDLLVISDEIYSELTFDGRHTSIATLPGMKERTVLLHGFSKAFAMTGFRIGYACGPQEIIDAMMKVHQYSMLCAPILSQEAAIEALKNGGPAVQKMKSQYRQRRDYIVKRFNGMGIPCHTPGGSFYVFPDIRPTGKTSKEFATELLNTQSVAVVPGTAFGEAGEGFVRAAFSTSYENLIEACNRIEAMINL
ncbi:MAG: aminotransferase class I/II-fold pyridoxal phosphate-dependent enzyme [Opitutales bacterium]|nr:aminotransferase class I/II-fold pyridoxal phosphate-dependent enzyme [Opitutales bacterium]